MTLRVSVLRPKFSGLFFWKRQTKTRFRAKVLKIYDNPAIASYVLRYPLFYTDLAMMSKRFFLPTHKGLYRDKQISVITLK